MAKSSKKPRRQGPPAPLAELVARNAARNGGSEGADPRAADQRALGRAAPPRLVPPPRALLAASLAADGGKGKFSSPQSLEKSRNQKILGSSCSRD
jgi:hypothetical protein